MQELVTVEQAEAVLRTLVWAGPLLGLVIGAIAGAVLRQGASVAWRGLAVGLLGPIIYALWRLFGYMVRYNPQTERAGLHSVATLALSALLFIVVGALLGAFYRRVVFPGIGRARATDSGPDVLDTENGQ